MLEMKNRNFNFWNRKTFHRDANKNRQYFIQSAQFKQTIIH